MASLAPAGLPPHPPSVAEWEDLLLRMEIMPRVVRVTLEEVPSGAVVLATLREMVERDALLGGWLHRASGLPDEAPPAAASGDARALAERFASLRARNFAMLQRRGLEVWEWVAEHQGAPVTAYQMVTALVRSDAAALEALREGRRLGQGAC